MKSDVEPKFNLSESPSFLGAEQIKRYISTCRQSWANRKLCFISRLLVSTVVQLVTPAPAAVAASCIWLQPVINTSWLQPIATRSHQLQLQPVISRERKGWLCDDLDRQSREAWVPTLVTIYGSDRAWCQTKQGLAHELANIQKILQWYTRGGGGPKRPPSPPLSSVRHTVSINNTMGSLRHMDRQVVLHICNCVQVSITSMLHMYT